MMTSTTARLTIDGEDADPDQNRMNIVYLEDKGGNRLKMQVYEGKYYVPYYNPDFLQDKATMKMRPDDIYLVAFLRTGTHWVFEMVSMLLNGRAETIRKSKGRHQLEGQSARELDSLPSPRLLDCHLLLSDAPKQLVEKRCKIIYNLRDPRDVAVSLYNFYIDFPSVSEYYGKFEDFFYLFLEGKVDCNGMFNHLRDAEKFFDEHPENPVHFQIYEETSKNPLLEVQRLSDFLGLERNDDLCRAIADKCEFSKMKVDKDNYTVKIDGKAALFRKGVVGDWRNYFSEEMLEDYYRVYEEKMKGSRFYQRYARPTS